MKESNLAESYQKFKDAIQRGDHSAALNLLNLLKMSLLSFESLPPLGKDSPTASAERAIARDIFENAVVLCIKLGDKESFQRHLTSLRPYYSTYRNSLPESELMYTILGVNLLYLLVENRLADFHCERELLSQSEQDHPFIAFCSKLDQHLMVGSYDQVMAAAAHPPVELYKFFLDSLLETVRLNIAECAAAAYKKLSIVGATDILMFHSEQETLDFVRQHYPSWVVSNSLKEIQIPSEKLQKSEGIPSLKLISQTLSYASELERIV